MAAASAWRIPAARQPDPGRFRYDLDVTLASVVGVRAVISDDAFTAETLGTERAGSGVLIRDGVVLTIGYLITEAEEVWLSTASGRVLAGHPLAYDQATGFGLIQALGKLDLPVMPLGESAAADSGMQVVVAGPGGRQQSVAAVIVGKQEFAGYWEYVLDEAIFTAPAHPFWGGAAVVGPAGDLIGIGSLQVEQSGRAGEGAQLNMSVPIDLLKPILPDLLSTGRAPGAARPWLGLFATELQDRVFVAGLATGGPADRSGLQPGDIVAEVGGAEVDSLAGFFRAIWALGPAGVDVPLTMARDGETLEVRVASADRNSFLKSPRMHS